jgi:hypothetical protein
VAVASSSLKHALSEAPAPDLNAGTADLLGWRILDDHRFGSTDLGSLCAHKSSPTEVERRPEKLTPAVRPRGADSCHGQANRVNVDLHEVHRPG